MRKCPLSLLIVLMSANLACADTLTLTIPLTSGQTKAAGFREIPPGRHTYIVTLTASTIYNSSWGGGGYVTWLPTSTPSGGSSHVYTTSTVYDQYEIGAQSGYAYLSMSMMPPYYGMAMCLTTNATWSTPVMMPPGPFYNSLHTVGIPWTDLTLPSSFPADGLSGDAIPSYNIASYSSGYVWFTSDDSNLAMSASTRGPIPGSRPTRRISTILVLAPRWPLSNSNSTRRRRFRVLRISRFVTGTSIA